MKKIYLACPYTSHYKFGFFNILHRWIRFWKVTKKASELMTQNYCVFSPISMTHPIAIAKRLPGHWEFWKKQDTPFIEWCDEFHILCLNGWNKSTGVKGELEEVKKLNKPVIYHENKK